MTYYRITLSDGQVLYAEDNARGPVHDEPHKHWLFVSGKKGPQQLSHKHFHRHQNSPKLHIHSHTAAQKASLK